MIPALDLALIFLNAGIASLAMFEILQSEIVDCLCFYNEAIKPSWQV